MLFTPEFLDEIRARILLSEVIGSSVRLERRGSEYVGLCPFHQEKSPSFTVTDSKGFYHCFGCGAHGDVIRYVVETENLTFPEAVERLAGRAGLAMPERSPEQRERYRRAATFHDVLEEASRWFESQLAGSTGNRARAYLSERRVSDATRKRFRLGYAPDERNRLMRHLAGKGISRELVIEAGLAFVGDGDREPVDRFRHRLIFPITDRKGRVAGFGGRAMGNQRAKYLNSPETPVFHKGHLLYGFTEARKPAHDAGTVVVVEGYMDAIALVQAGIQHVVAPLGTALTEGHLALLWKLADEPVLCFDGDTAGYSAACRAMERALPVLRAGKSLRFVLLADGMDPDDIVRVRGAASIRDLIDRAIPLMDMLWQSRTRGRALETPERRAGLERELMTVIGTISDRAVGHYYRGEIIQRLKAAFGPPRYRGDRLRPGERRRLDRRRRESWTYHRGVEPVPGSVPGGGPAGDAHLAERALVAIPFLNPGLLEKIAEPLSEVSFLDSRHERLQQCLIGASEADGDLDNRTISDHLTAAGLDDLMKDVVQAESFSCLVMESVGEAEDLWHHVHDLHRCRNVLGQEIRAEADAWDNNPTAQAWQRLVAMIEEREGWQGRVLADDDAQETG